MTITHDEATTRFENLTAAGTAFVDYQRDGPTVTFTHTLVPKGARGQGVGSALIGHALAWATREDLTVVAQCPFVAAYIESHPETV
ncbi:MAG: N-acetyltransferase [Rhodothermales bacterium]|nr:N-acetyltransferase [Rhodothermales bacterium]